MGVGTPWIEQERPALLPAGMAYFFVSNRAHRITVRLRARGNLVWPGHRAETSRNRYCGAISTRAVYTSCCAPEKLMAFRNLSRQLSRRSLDVLTTRSTIMGRCRFSIAPVIGELPRDRQTRNIGSEIRLSFQRNQAHLYR
jgi:hypothetical protein